MRVEDKDLDRKNEIAFWVSILMLGLALSFVAVDFVQDRMVNVLRIPIDMAASIVLAIIN